MGMFIKIKQDFHGISKGVATSSPGLARQELARNATGENSFNPKHVVLQEMWHSGTVHHGEVKGTHPAMPYFSQEFTGLFFVGFLTDTHGFS